MILGSCLCGRVQYAITCEITSMGLCHCHNCQKITGSAFTPAAWITYDSVEWREGEEHLTRYESSLGIFRCFCRHCGSSLIGVAPDHNLAGVYAGTLDGDHGFAPSIHIYTSSKAPWYQIQDHLPQLPTE